MSTNTLFVYWIGFLPLVVWGWAYEGPKVLWFLTGSLFLFFHWLKNKEKLTRFLNKADKLFLLWLGVLLISSLLGETPLQSIIGGSYRHQGVLFFFALWLLGKTVSAFNPKQKKLLAKIIFRVAIFEAILIIVQKFLAPEVLIFGRPPGTMGEPNAVGGFLAGAAVFVGWIPALALVVLAVILTSSRTSLVSLALIGLGFILKSGKIPVKKSLVLGIAFLVVSFFVFIKAGASRPFSKFENRPLFWRMAVKFIREKPLLGYGAESGERLYGIEYARREMPLQGLIIDRAHNLLLDVAIWSGSMGLFLFAGWILTEAIKLFQKRQYMNLFGILALVAFSFFQPLGVTHWVLLMILMNI